MVPRITPLAALGLALLLGGCGTRLFADRETNPVVEDYLSKSWFDVDVGILATTAIRRTVLVKLAGPEDGHICSEPPPDVGEALAKASAFHASTALSLPDGSGEGRIDAERRLATSIAALLKRSQGLQLLRDVSYSLCVDRLNGWISTERYEKAKAEARTAAVALVNAEVPHLGPFAPTSPPPPTPPSPTLSPAGPR